MPKIPYLTDAQLIVVGRRHGSDEVAIEASEALERWRRDLSSLAGYGYGQPVLDAFVADVAAQATLCAARPEAVADKRMSVVVRDKHVSAAWTWVDRVVSMLGVPARAEQALAMALMTAKPASDAGLEAGIRALAVILEENQGRLPPDAHADQRLAEVDALCADLRASPGAVHTSKGQTVADTQQIDLLDGKLYVCVRDLNAAARAAVRNGDLRASLADYTFHHLKRSGNPNPLPGPASASTSQVDQPQQPSPAG